jgi:DNA-binding NarL/FixJ family response regulator
MGTACRVVVAEDSVLLREGLASLLEAAGFVVAGQATTAEELLRDVRLHEPDVAIVDVRLPPTHTDEGLRAAHTICTQHPATGVLILSQHVEPSYALELLGGGCRGIGYLLKDRVFAVEEFVSAVRRVAAGGTVMEPAVVSALLGRSARNGVTALTHSERAVLALMAEGLSNGAIARRLYLSLRTVERHVGAIFDRLGLHADADGHRRVRAVLTFLREAA